tara:strand:+ start:1110 stop:1820 length:711 start_codon:yes stop_codon:yes gene_type:complete
MNLLELLKEIAEDKEYGEVLFGDKNNPPEFAKLQGAKPGSEPDLSAEKKLLLILKKWTGHPAHAIKDLYKLHGKLKTLANDYPKILKPESPNGTILYRGLTDVNPQIEAQVKSSKAEDWVRVGRLYILKTPITYVPRSDIQSWTSSMSTGQYSFGDSGMLITKQTDEFMLNQKALSILYGLIEDEVLHFGKDYSQANVYFSGDMISNIITKYKKKLANVKIVADNSKKFNMNSIVK